MIKQLTKLANDLDSKGLRREADYLDNIIIKLCADIDTIYYYPNDKVYKYRVDCEKKIWYATGGKWGNEWQDVTKWVGSDLDEKATTKPNGEGDKPCSPDSPEGATEEVSDAQLRQEEAKIVLWNKEWLETLKPGTLRGKKLAGVLNLDNLEGNQESRYKWWWKSTLKPILTLKLPGSDQLARLQFLWNPDLGMPPEEKGHGAYGLATRWDNRTAQIQIWTPYWFNKETTDAKRKWLLLHELEHILDFIAPNTETHISSSEGQAGLYDEAFSRDYLPPIFKQLNEKHSKIFEELHKKYQIKLPDSSFQERQKLVEKDPRYPEYEDAIEKSLVPISLGWGSGKSDQRSETQTLLASNGGVMDMKLMNKLCGLKTKVEKWNWVEKSWDEKKSFIESIYKESLIRVEMLVMLNCKDKQKTIDAINGMANVAERTDRDFDPRSETRSGGRPSVA